MGREQKQGGGEGVKKAFCKIMGFAGKCFLSPSLLPSPLPFFVLAPFRARPKYENRLFIAENSTETLATQAKLQHTQPPPPLRAYPGHLTALAFKGVGNLIPMHKGWGI